MAAKPTGAQRGDSASDPEAANPVVTQGERAVVPWPFLLLAGLIAEIIGPHPSLVPGAA
jgi:hypothetical protein